MSSNTIVGTVSVALRFEESALNKDLASAAKTIQTALNGASVDSGKKSSKIWSNTFVASLLGNLAAAGIQKVFRAISSSMDAAIKRVDTLNNSSKVFQALGYSTDETSRSMDRLVGYLDGLPTSMTTAVGGVQSLASSFGSLDKGTDYFIAMNDAGLAFGATTEMVENAITQLGQLSLDGPLDAATWNSLRNSGFSPVFAAMAKEAGITVGELKESFGANGTKTVQDFLDELVRMDVDGTSSMDSLSEVARKNTDGIGTAMENVQNRIGKAIAKIIDHIGSDEIANAINTVSSSFSGIADTVIGLMDFLGQNQWILDGILAFLGSLLALGIAQKVTTFFASLGAFAASNPIIFAITLIITALGWIMTHLDEVGAFFNTVFGAIGEFVGGIAEGIGNFFNGVFTWIGENLSWLGSVFEEIFGFVGSVLGTFFDIFSTIFGLVWDIASSIFGTIGSFIGTIFSGIMVGLEILFGIFSSIFGAIFQVVSGVFEAIRGPVEAVWNFITGLFGNLASFFGSIFSGAWEAVKAVFSTGGKIFAGIVDGIANAFRTIVNAIITGINFVVAIPFNAINGFLGILRGINILGFQPFGWVGEIGVPQIPLLAKGGYADGASNVMIGEDGREVVLPLENNTDNWAGLLARVLVTEMDDNADETGPTINIEKQEFIVSNGFDAREAGRQFMQEIRRLA